jgi:(R)-2-hydroxyacyl-CoA dehydratese activating ATPase
MTKICAGIDAGSRTIKVVLLDAAGPRLVAGGVVDQGVQQQKLAMDLLDRLLAQQGLGRDDLGPVVATGYGRKLIRIAHRSVTEITCQAGGVHHLLPDARTIIDVGGQDSKLVRLNARGTVEDFVMNDRCAAGTGRFLEVVATQLEVALDELAPLLAASPQPAPISSMCVVFAETEIVGLLASGARREDILAGVEASLATRIAAMGGRSLPGPVVFTGGVALVPGMDAALEAALGTPVRIAPHCQLTAALGAALLALQQT